MTAYTVVLVLTDDNDHEGTAVFAGHITTVLQEDDDVTRTVVRHVEADDPKSAAERALDMVLRRSQAQSDAWVLADMEERLSGG